MDLYRVKDKVYFRWSNHGWLAVLDLAERYGWQPIGTKPSELMKESWGEEMCLNWNGRYDTNEYQIISDDDAGNMAAALERALPDIPDENALIDKGELRVLPKFLTCMTELGNLDGQELKHRLSELEEQECFTMAFSCEEWEALNILEKFAENYYHQNLIDFIAYLRVGGCEIH